MKRYIVILNTDKDVCRCYLITDREFGDIISAHCWVSIVDANSKVEAISKGYTKYKEAIAS